MLGGDAVVRQRVLPCGVLLLLLLAPLHFCNSRTDMPSTRSELPTDISIFSKFSLEFDARARGNLTCSQRVRRGGC